VKIRLAVLAVPLVVAATLFATAGAGAADTYLISGNVTDFTCGPLHAIGVESAATIDATATSGAAAAALSIELVNTSGAVVARTAASGDGAALSYNTSQAGVYAVRVCLAETTVTEQAVTYHGTLSATTPARQISATSGVAGASATLTRHAAGYGAVRSGSGLAWFRVRAAGDGTAELSYDDAVRNVHIRQTTEAKAIFGRQTVTIRGRGITLVLVDLGARDTIRVTAGAYKAAGTVVRGGLRVR
jgi:hypothetical protein